MPHLLPFALFILGTILGAAANFLIYRQRMQPRPISPWVWGDPRASKRRWFDFIPIFGWLSLRRESAVFGPGFWVRPLLVELLMGVGVAALYQYEIQGGLLPAVFPRPFDSATLAMLNCQFAAHVVLIFWLTVASLIDTDETIIPDSIVIPGTLMGLALSAFCPLSLLPNAFQVEPSGEWKLKFMQFTSPIEWPVWLDSASGLIIGLGCWLLWCFALLPRSWYPRHGWQRALQLCGARIRREMFSLLILGLAIFGVVAIAICWHCGGSHWAGLLTALVGMAVGGGVVWAVRIICSAAMQREAMGFGDVTLMAMIGVFVGWQASLAVFFLSPFAALVFLLVRLAVSRNREIYFGPFLSLAALAVILYWDAIWDQMYGVFMVGWLVPMMLVVCFALMPILLLGIRRLLGR